MFPGPAMGLGSRGQYQWPFATRGLGTGLLAPFAESGIVVTVTIGERTLRVQGTLDTIEAQISEDLLHVFRSEPEPVVCVDAPGNIRLYYRDGTIRVRLTTPDIEVQMVPPIGEIRAQADTEDVG